MSRGPGTWQRGILAAVEQLGAVYLCDLLPTGAPKAQYHALYRAARRLEELGRILVYQGGFRRMPLILARLGTSWQEARDCPRHTTPPAPLRVKPGRAEPRFNAYDQEAAA